MEEEKEIFSWTVFTTFIFSNIKAIDDQEVRFIPDWRDAELEFLNLQEVKNFWGVLPTNMRGLNLITDSVEKLRAFATAQQVMIEPVEE